MHSRAGGQAGTRYWNPLWLRSGRGVHWVSEPKQKWKDIGTRRQQQCRWWHAGDRQNRWLEKRYINTNSSHSSPSFYPLFRNAPWALLQLPHYYRWLSHSRPALWTVKYICMSHHLTEEAASLTKARGSIYTDKYLERSLTTWPLSKTVSVSSPLGPMASQDLGFQYFQLQAWLQSWGAGLKSNQERGWLPYKLSCLYCSCRHNLTGRSVLQHAVLGKTTDVSPPSHAPAGYTAPFSTRKASQGRENSLVSSRIDFTKSYNQCGIFSNRVLQPSGDG